jgi:RimJ/RimL family protein N-acetyltransferase
METDPAVMAELGGPVPREEIPALHRRRLDGVATDPWWFVVVTDDGEAAGTIGIWETEHDGATVHETGWMLARRFHGRGAALRAAARLARRHEPGVERAVPEVRVRAARRGGRPVSRRDVPGQPLGAGAAAVDCARPDPG